MTATNIAPNSPDTGTTEFSVVQAFYLDTQLFEVGDTAKLTDSQAKRLADYVKLLPAKTATAKPAV